MEEAPVVDCPPTPEILPLSSTPPPRTDVVYSSSSEDGDEPTDGRRSPPPKCAICLGKCRQRAYTNSCKHQFCFRCLLEWSKVKPECPLCKQRFFSIVYYKSIDCFEQHTVAVPSANVPRVSTRNMYHELNLFLTNSQRFTAYAIPNMTLRLQSNNERLQELLLHQSSEVDRFIREYGNQPIPTRQDELRWRQFIYANRLYACPLPDLNGRFRETSAAFYRDNPAQMHRVLSWMHRDLLVLSTNIAIHAPNMNVLEDLLQTHDIDSREFLLRILRHMTLEDGEHFQHECVNFARSPYDMIGYDRCVQYNPRFVQRRVRSQVIISSSEEDDDIVYLPEPAAGTSSNAEAPVIEINAGGEGASNGNSGATGTGSNSTATSGPTNARGGRSEVHIEFRSLADSVGSEEVRPVSTSGTLPRIPLTSTVSSSVEATENILLSSSDSDDCQFVMAQKPPHLRTPDHVVDLESASDSDVVFVAEEPVDVRATGRTARQQQQGNSMKKETAGTQEYNNGASTSSGYCGGGNGGGGSSGSVASGSALRSKYYVRPRSTRYSGGMGVKSIYEASDTDDSDSDTLFNLPHGRRTLSNTANDSSSHDEVDFGGAQRKRRKPNKKTTTTLPKGSKRASRKRRHSSVSSSSSNDGSDSNSCSSDSNSDEESNTSSSNSSCSSSCSDTSSNSSSRSSSTSSSYAYGGSSGTTLHRNVIVEIECGRQLRRNTTAQQSRTTCTTRSMPGQTDSKTRTKKKRSRRTIEKESKRSKEKIVSSASKSKSRHTKKKKKSQTASRTARDVTKGSRTKSKSNARGVSARSSKAKKRTKPSDDEPSRSTPALEEDILEENASTRAHYVIASRASVSPTLDVTTVDGTECRERKLKSVIIKRCHYDKLSTRRSNDVPDGAEAMPSGSVTSVAAVPDSVAEPSTSTSLPPEESVPESGNFAKMEPVDVADELKHEPVTNDMQLSFSSSSSSDSEAEAPNDSDWMNSRMYSAVTGLVQMHRNSLFNPSSLEQQQHQQLQQQQQQLQQEEQQDQHNQQHAQPHWQQPEEYIPAQLQLPINNNDQQQHGATLAGNDALLQADVSNTVASESIFEPTLSWAETDRPLIPEDRGLSSAAASPFSSISFPPSTTSVSPSPSMSSQSLALAVATSPLQLIESLITMDSDSPLPSSVLGIEAIDGAMDDIMANEVASGTAALAEPSLGMDGEDVQATASAPCGLNPTSSDGAPTVPLQL